MIRAQYSLAIIIIVSIIVEQDGPERSSQPPCTDWLLSKFSYSDQGEGKHVNLEFSCCSPVEVCFHQSSFLASSKVMCT